MNAPTSTSANPATGTTGPPSATPAGWDPDPDAAHQLRYWDGRTWTEHRAPGTAGEQSAVSDESARADSTSMSERLIAIVVPVARRALRVMRANPKVALAAAVGAVVAATVAVVLAGGVATSVLGGGGVSADEAVAKFSATGLTCTASSERIDRAQLRLITQGQPGDHAAELEAIDGMPEGDYRVIRCSDERENVDYSDPASVGRSILADRTRAVLFARDAGGTLTVELVGTGKSAVGTAHELGVPVIVDASTP